MLDGSKTFNRFEVRVPPNSDGNEDIHKTAFRTNKGYYKFVIMLFELSNGPATFQSTMDNLFKPFLRKFVTVFFVVILIYSSTIDIHLDHLTRVFRKLIEAKLFLKLSKIFVFEIIN